MKKVTRILVFVSVFGLLFVSGAPAQMTVKPPFLAGEKLVYEGKISKIIQGIAVADLLFSFGRAADGGDYLIKTDARSKGTLLKLFRFSFVQEYESTVDSNRFRILKTVKNDVQKDRVRKSEALFSYVEKRVTFSETNPMESMRAPRTIASDLKGDTHDLVSGLYFLRTLPLAVGKVFELTISDSGLIYQVPVRVTAREIQKSIFGRVMCFRVEPEVFGNNRLIEQKGSMVIWIMDDERRIPVRSRIRSEYGKIEVKLKKVESAKL